MGGWSDRKREGEVTRQEKIEGYHGRVTMNHKRYRREEGGE